MRGPCDEVVPDLAFPPLAPPCVPDGSDRPGGLGPVPRRAADHPGRRGGALVRSRGGTQAAGDRLGAPVITTLNAKGILDERDPLSLGHARSARARAALPHADAMLAVGCRFTEVLTDWRRMPVPKQLVQIDLDADQIGMNYPVAVGIVADARAALAALCDRLPDGSWRERLGATPRRGPPWPGTRGRNG